MKEKRKVAIWLDHSTAKMISAEGKEMDESLDSNFTFRMKVEAAHRSENLMHNKEQQLHEAFYKEIGVEMLKFDYVLLFGPTNAKRELFNYVKQDLHFKDMEIDVEPVDYKLTENEKLAFVREYFAA